MVTFFLVLFAYLLGSLSSAILICRLGGYPDPRTQGSHNPGATNVLRLTSKTMAATVLLADFSKGLVAVLVAQHILQDERSLVLVCLAVIAGHAWPLYFCFKGGKGVATSLGVITALAWPVAILALLIWLLTFALTGISSLSALTACALLPLCSYWLAPVHVWVISTICLGVIGLHYPNIQRLRSGQEATLK